MRVVLPKKEAVRIGAEHYYAFKPCKRGHWCARRVKGGCIECQMERDRKRKKDFLKFLVSRKKANAKFLDIEFDITEEDLHIPSYCPVLGIEIKPSNVRGGSNNSPSIDRVDSTKDYVKGNVRVISNRANAMKSDMTIEQVESLLEYMKS